MDTSTSTFCRFSPLRTPVLKKFSLPRNDVSDTESVITRDIRCIAQSVSSKLEKSPNPNAMFSDDDMFISQSKRKVNNPGKSTKRRKELTPDSDVCFSDFASGSEFEPEIVSKKPQLQETLSYSLLNRQAHKTETKSSKKVATLVQTKSKGGKKIMPDSSSVASSSESEIGSKKHIMDETRSLSPKKRKKLETRNKSSREVASPGTTNWKGRSSKDGKRMDSDSDTSSSDLASSSESEPETMSEKPRIDDRSLSLKKQKHLETGTKSLRKFTSPVKTKSNHINQAVSDSDASSNDLTSSSESEPETRLEKPLIDDKSLSLKKRQKLEAQIKSTHNRVSSSDKTKSKGGKKIMPDSSSVASSSESETGSNWKGGSSKDGKRIDSDSDTSSSDLASSSESEPETMSEKPRIDDRSSSLKKRQKLEAEIKSTHGVSSPYKTKSKGVKRTTSDSSSVASGSESESENESKKKRKKLKNQTKSSKALKKLASPVKTTFKDDKGRVSSSSESSSGSESQSDPELQKQSDNSGSESDNETKTTAKTNKTHQRKQKNGYDMSEDSAFETSQSRGKKNHKRKNTVDSEETSVSNSTNDLRYKIPQEFEIDASPQYLSKSEIQGKQLWLITAPEDFDISGLHKQKINMSGCRIISPHNIEDETQYEVVSRRITGQTSTFCSVAAGSTGDEAFVIGSEMSGQIQVMNWIPTMPPVEIVKPPPTKHRVPDNLQRTFVPFGSMSPVRENADETIVPCKKRKHKKKKDKTGEQLSSTSPQDV